MPWQLEAMKDVGACEKLLGVGNQTLIRRYPNGETHWARAQYPLTEYIGLGKRTRGTETSQYLQEKKSTEIPLVVASERGRARHVYRIAS